MAYRLKLIKALSYTGVVSATKSNPYVEVTDKKAVAKAIATGYFESVTEDIPTHKTDDDKRGKKLREMSVSELETLASYKGVNIKGINKKADIIKKITEELPKDETEGEVIYGSPTMTALQEECFNLWVTP